MRVVASANNERDFSIEATPKCLKGPIDGANPISYVDSIRFKGTVELDAQWKMKGPVAFQEDAAQATRQEIKKVYEERWTSKDGRGVYPCGKETGADSDESVVRGIHRDESYYGKTSFEMTLKQFDEVQEKDRAFCE